MPRVSVKPGGEAEITFSNQLKTYEKLSHADKKTNTFNGYKALEVHDKAGLALSPAPATNMYTATVEKSALNPQLIRGDGTKTDITSDFSKLVITRNAADTEFTLFDNGATITIKGRREDLAGSSYKLTATYDNKFTDEFELSFSPVTLFDKTEKTVVFRNDALNRSHYMDGENETNIYSLIGNISINLTEGSFDPETTYPVVPGSVVEKAPKIANDGNRDEFVLMTVTVPKAQVTLLDESGSNKGNPKTGLDSIQQLFRLVAEQTDPNTVLQVPTISGRDIDFTYHSGSDTGEGADGWVLLTSDTTGSDYDLYVFGYNKKMLPADETVTLFDKVQLKSFIDGEKKDGVTIGVKGYGIQGNYLRGTNVDFTKAHYSAADLNEIYSIVRNKAGI